MVLEVDLLRATQRAARRVALDARVRALFKASKRTYGSPRIHVDLLEAGETVSVNTVADSMRRQGLQGRKPKRRRGLTRQDKSAPEFRPGAPRLHRPGAEREVVRGHHRDPHRRRQAVFRFGAGSAFARAAGQRDLGSPRAALACDAIKMAAAVRGGHDAIDGVIFHTDRGSTYTATNFTTLCRKLGLHNRWEGSVHVSITPRAGVLLDPRTRGPVPAPLHHQSPRTPGCGALVPGLLQPPTPTQDEREVDAWLNARRESGGLAS